MVLSDKAVKAVEKKDRATLLAELKKSGYSDGAAEYLAGKLLGEIDDGRTIL